MFYHLPPVGNQVCLHVQAGASVSSLFASYQVQFYASGTAALAAAICVAIKLKNGKDSEIILPAYSCPDLVSAVIYAGAKPVLVDFEVERPWLNLSLLADAITKKTVAIVAVNLFGIAERWVQLRELANQADLLLIEDSAQYFPGGDERQSWHGDLVVLSFGRGKPVSLLGGGAVLTKNTALFECLEKPKKSSVSLYQRLLLGLKARSYNAMISPFVYWLPQALPFLHLGETRYHALTGIDAMDQGREALLVANISRYQDDVETIRRCKKISNILDTLDQVINLPQVCGVEWNRRLLRYPLLLDAGLRDDVYRQLNQAGLGASIMYPDTLPGINGLNHLFEKKDFPQARAFAASLITLPTHNNVNNKDIKKIKNLFDKHQLDR